MSKNLEKTCQEILEQAGIKINGNNPWDMQVHSQNFYRRVLAGGSLALGESYMDGWWDCDKLDEFFYRILKAGVDKKAEDYMSLGTKVRIGWEKLKSKVSNQQNILRSRRVAEQHYDLGNELFEKMLGKTMAYSCGYWKDVTTLDEAQDAKFDLVCRKLELKSGMSVLDIGCGFGTLLEYAARNYGISGVGITLSKEQARAAIERCKGLNVEIRVQDYRQIMERFDRVVSIGMFEHVGQKNYRRFFQDVEGCLENDGLFLLHTIGSLSLKGGTDPWLEKYIFPGGSLPSEPQIINASHGLFINEDLHNFRADYPRTLRAWHDNFAENWQEIKRIGNGRYDERFKRMWNYYLLSCKASFEIGGTQLWQFVFSKPEFNIDYQSVR